MEEAHYIKNKIVLVTGGSKGIGSAICSLLKRNEAIVIDASINSITSVIDEVKPGNVYHKQADVSNEESVEALFSWIDDNFSGIDILINNAGVLAFKPIAEMSFAEWSNMMKVNLDGTFLCTKHSLQKMLPKKNGQIINIGSLAGEKALPLNGAYGSSKAAVKMLTQIINEEYADQGIKASILILGAVATAISENFPEIDRSEMISPEKAASTILHIIESNHLNRLEEVCLLPSFRSF